eukprot:4545540-Prymnesium_polylepis.1
MVATRSSRKKETSPAVADSHDSVTRNEQLPTPLSTGSSLQPPRVTPPPPTTKVEKGNASFLFEDTNERRRRATAHRVSSAAASARRKLQRLLTSEPDPVARAREDTTWDVPARVATLITATDAEEGDTGWRAGVDAVEDWLEAASEKIAKAETGTRAATRAPTGKEGTTEDADEE